jgi:hypothetical protein
VGTILHQYISAANIKKVCEIGLLVPQVCISLPIGGTGSFFQYIGATGNVTTNTLVD